MNKRLQKMIDENKIPNMEGVFIDAYNQSINKDIAGTITTRVDASNMIFVTELCNIKEKKYNPMKVSIGTPLKSSFADKLGGISRCVKTDDSLATVIMENHGTTNTITSVAKDNMVVEPLLRIPYATKDGKQPSAEQKMNTENINYRIRKLTPRECFRLMDVDETDIDKIQQAGISNTQQYKLAGNSIVVSCLYHIFRKMFTETENENQQLTLF